LFQSGPFALEFTNELIMKAFPRIFLKVIVHDIAADAEYGMRHFATTLTKRFWKAGATKIKGIIDHADRMDGRPVGWCGRDR